MRLDNIISQMSVTYEVLSSPFRLIILSLLADREASWSELNNKIEEKFGRINPNTLNFHLNKLIKNKIVEKKGDTYSLSEEAKNNEIIKKALEEVRKNI